MTTEKKVYTLRLQDENFAKIKAISELEKRSIAMQIELIIERFIADYEKEHGAVDID